MRPMFRLFRFRTAYRFLVSAKFGESFRRSWLVRGVLASGRFYGNVSRCLEGHVLVQLDTAYKANEMAIFVQDRSDPIWV